MTLTPRKERILKAVVDSYINKPSPVSSKEIQVSQMPDTSSATIRNELAALEELGYLVQPHTSSGRIPTAEAYRLYVEKLMPARKLTARELGIIKKHFGTQLLEIDDILKKTAKVISEVTNYTSVAFAPKIRDAVIRNIKLVKVSAVGALVIIVTDLGVIKDTVIETREELDDAYFEAASRFILRAFYNRTIAEILSPDTIIREQLEEYRFFFDSILKILSECFGKEGDIVMDGASKLLEYPEYSNVDKARAVMRVLDAKEKLYPMLRGDNEVSLNIKIGQDADGGAFSDCAVITTNYQVKGKAIANAGVIGPIRMDYPLVISVLDYIGKTLNGLPSDD
jgi:heat-inducible transcriptional repressor